MMKWINKKRNRKGFTLVELVVVIAILGILGGIAVPKLGESRKTAAQSAHNSNVRVLYSAATMFVAEKGVGTASATTWKGNDSDTGLAAEWKNYVQSWPKAPTGTGKTKDNKDLSGEYEVTIDNDGNITVKNGTLISPPTGLEF